ncbi:MAG: serine/threonine protein kinase, partial [Actinomycetota bacterium]|nr:serine/threonine protein kinase [Actinomycetota bacterium]
MTAHAGRTGPVEMTAGPAESGETAPEPRQHERLGPYRLIQRLGEGGMGVVHLALDPQGRAVAVKVLRPHIAYDPEARSRLERELETLSRVRDDRVAAVIDADIFGERPYLVTRYVPGPSLDEVVGEQGPLHGADLLRLGRGLVDALEAIHAVGVVHRDLKPGNVLLEDGEPVLIDFGIAHVADDVRLTSVGLVMGTPGYLSPEVVAGGAVTEATDWWGWAATVAYAASGQPPFGRGPMDVVLDRVRRGESDLTGVDPRLLPVLEAALSPDPRRRPPVGEVVGALERYAAGGPATVALPAPGPTPDPWPTLVDDRPDPGWTAGPRTAALPCVEPPGSQGWAQAEQWPETDDDGGAQERRGEGDPRIGRPMRTGTLVAVATVLTAGAVSWPGVVVIAVAAWCWMARFSDRTLSALVVRRFERGRRRSDVPRAVVASPWHLLVSAVGTVVGLALPALVAAAGVVCASLALGA